MLLTELNMLILQFVVLIFLFTIFTVLHIYKMFFFKHYNLQYLHCLRDAAGGGWGGSGKGGTNRPGANGNGTANGG